MDDVHQEERTMRLDVIMPQMGESIAEVTLTRWLKKPGDTVARDEPIFEISTDKVDAEIPAPAAGVLGEIKVQEGQTVPINTVVAFIETEAGAAAGAGKAEAGAAKPEAGAAKAKAAAAPEAPKAAPQAPAKPAAKAPEPETPAAAAPEVRPGAAPAPQPAPRPQAASGPIPKAAVMAAAGASVEEMRRVRSSPVVRKIAEEHQIDLQS